MSFVRRVAGAAGLLGIFCLVNCAAVTEEEEPTSSEDAVTGETCSTADCVLKSGPSELSYDELVKLSTINGKRNGARYQLTGAPAGLEDKLNELLDTPFVSNEAFHNGARKFLPVDPELGPTMRAAAWNIERGEQLPLILEALRAANDDKDARDTFLGHVKDGILNDPQKVAKIKEQLDALAKTDLLILNELDRGMKRSNYEDVVGKLARELKMNYAYGVEFVEVDPLVLGTEKLQPEDFATYDTQEKKDVPETDPEALGSLAKEANEALTVDKSRVKALHGNAVLSRYPILKARLVPLKTPQTKASGCWDWNADEKKEPGFINGWIQAGQRYAAEKIFLQKIMRETRHGGRGVLLVDLKVNGLDTPVTVVNAHIEAKGTPQCRRAQMNEILDMVKTIRNPIVMAGDLNTTGADGRPMTVERLLLSKFGNPEFYIRQVVKRLVPYAGWGFMAYDRFKFFKKLDDPTSMFHPEHAMFDDIKRAGFDFRGEKLRTVNETKKTLANSNQRDGKGFKTTFSFERTIAFIGKMKLDWFLIRGYSAIGDDKKSYRMAPHFPRTLEELNQSTSPRLSDHYPITVVLPLKDPCLGKPEGTCVVPDRIEEDDFAISTQ